MRQIEGNNHSRKGKHLNWEERIQIETLQRAGHSATQIGQTLNRPARTIRREIKRGWVIHRVSKYAVDERYSADRGREEYEKRTRCRTRAQPANERLQEYLYLHGGL